MLVPLSYISLLHLVPRLEIGLSSSCLAVSFSSPPVPLGLVLLLLLLLYLPSNSQIVKFYIQSDGGGVLGRGDLDTHCKLGLSLRLSLK